MAIQVSRGGRDTPTALSEINVTPFVDVMLVLLVIFMVTAPLLQHGLGVELPKAEGTPLNTTPGQISLIINSQRQISVDGQPVETGTLRERLEDLSRNRPNLALYIQADAGIPYGFVAQVLAEVRKTSIQKIGLVTEPVETNRRF